MARVKALGAALLCTATLANVSSSRAGHEVSYYPSFYPQEIRIEPLEPAAAGREFLNKKIPLHAYIGASPRFDGEVPAFLKSVVSLSGLLVASVDPRSPRARTQEGRCAALAEAAAAVAGEPGAVAHAYPVTPYHADYLGHADRAPKPPTAGAARPQDVTVSEAAIADLVRQAGAGTGIWPVLAPAKQGWFQAYHLLRPGLSDKAGAHRADDIYERLIDSTTPEGPDRLNLERELVAVLVGSCERGVVGYRLRREFYSDDSANGVENIAADSQSGFNSPIAVRTMKLKDFPWNGWLRVGIDGRAKAAWNPVAGFSDPIGRLVWSVVGDDAYLPITHSSGWVQNRIEVVPDEEERKPSQSLLVPPDALIPEAVTGRLVPVGPAKGAMGRVIYRLAASAFQDGSEMEVADLLYPFALAFRWGEGGPGRPTFDPHVAAATRALRERLAGVRVARVDQRALQVADLTFRYRSPVVEIYLNRIASSEDESALIAPPWSSVPWHVLALMEAAVERGLAAFSEAEADRRGVPWLDLVRDKAQLAGLTALIKEFASSGYRPAALERLVDADAAVRRWQALDKFAQASGHLLVTNGPYSLASYAPDAYVFNVVRDFTYPVGLGTFDLFAYPSHAIVTRIEHERERVLLTADVEMDIKQQRNHRLERVALTHSTLRVIYPIRAPARYVLVGEGKVAATGLAKWEPDGRFAAPLPAGLSPGRYTLFAAIFTDGNTVDPSIGSIVIDKQ